MIFEVSLIGTVDADSADRVKQTADVVLYNSTAPNHLRPTRLHLKHPQSHNKYIKSSLCGPLKLADRGIFCVYMISKT
jgi:hypothetical protein